MHTLSYHFNTITFRVLQFWKVYRSHLNFFYTRIGLDQTFYCACAVVTWLGSNLCPKQSNPIRVKVESHSTSSELSDPSDLGTKVLTNQKPLFYDALHENKTDVNKMACNFCCVSEGTKNKWKLNFCFRSDPTLSNPIQSENKKLSGNPP